MSKLRHYAYIALKWLGKWLFRLLLAYVTRDRRSAHDRNWQDHPAVATAEQLTFGQRAADRLKALVATWTALFLVLAVIGWWLYLGGIPAGSDSLGFLHLNLALSCFAALQCFILLIAAKRADEIAAATAMHTLENTEALTALLQQNTDLTQQIANLTRLIHDHIVGAGEMVAPPVPPTQPAQQPTRRKRAQRILA